MQRRRRSGTLQRADGVVERVLARRVPRGPLRLARAMDLWVQVAPPSLVRHVCPGRIRGRRLTLHAVSPAWAHEASYLCPELARALKSRAPELGVSEVVVHAAPADFEVVAPMATGSYPRPLRSAHPARAAEPPSVPLPPAVAAAIEDAPSPALKSALAAAYRTVAGGNGGSPPG